LEEMRKWVADDESGFVFFDFELPYEQK